MSNNESMRLKGLRSMQIWIPLGLHQAIRDKLYSDRRTAQAAMTQLFSIWCGWKPDERQDTGTNENPSS